MFTLQMLIGAYSVTRLATNCITRASQIFADFLGNLENHRFLSQTGVATFGVTFGTSLDTLSLISGHTVFDP